MPDFNDALPQCELDEKTLADLRAELIAAVGPQAYYEPWRVEQPYWPEPPAPSAGSDAPRRARGERYVKTQPIQAAVRGRETDVLRAIGIGWPGRGDHIHCPFPGHPDKNPSWRWAEDHWFCTCGNGSIFDAVMRIESVDFEAAKVRVAEIIGRDDLIIDPAAEAGVTVAQIAETKKLPIDFLLKCGWFDFKNSGKWHNNPPAVGIPYRDKSGKQWLRIRAALAGKKNKFRWKKGDREAPLYGAWNSLEGVDHCFLVEGESDTVTLWHNRIPALGIPGAGNYSDERHAPTLDGVSVVYVPIEPDEGGDTVMAWLPHSSIAPRVRVIHMPPEMKDVSALYMKDPAGFIAALQGLMKTAQPVKLPDPDKPTENKEATRVTLDDFYGYLPEHKALFAPKRGELWPYATVDSMFPPISDDMSASQYLFKRRPMHGMTWLPGEPPIIRGKLMVEGGWVEREGFRCFNRYIPPRITLGDPKDAERWRQHLRLLYPNEADDIEKWCAHRVQRPGEKINFILVLGGAPGIGKDSILVPLKYAIGDSNFEDISAATVFAPFNGYAAAVVLRISEARDFGDGSRYQFYEHMKIYGAAPPDVLRVNEKNIKEYYVPNVVAVVITTNYKTDGMYIPRDDRRHLVAWSELPKPGKEPTAENPLCEKYFDEFHAWLASGGGNEAVAAYLMTLDLTDFNPKAPPKQTAAFLDISEANDPQEELELMDVLEALSNPQAVTVARITTNAKEGLGAWLKERKNRRLIPGRLERCGYVRVPNPDSPSDGRWRVNDERQPVFAQKALSQRERLEAAKRLADWGEASR